MVVLMELDLKQLVQIARRWWWLLLMLPMLAGGSAYAFSINQTPQYSATVMLQVNPPASAALDIDSLRLTQDLTETYRRLIITRPVLQAVIDTLDLQMDVDELTKRTTATAIPSTQLVDVSVTDPSPDWAALIANTIGTTFASQMASQNVTTDAAGNTAGHTVVSIAEPAAAPKDPYSPKIILNTIGGVLAGLVLAAGLILLLQYFDNSVSDASTLQEAAQSPVLATVWSLPLPAQELKHLYTLDRSLSPSAEAIRLLRTNIEFAAAGHSVKKMTVTSPGTSEGKSTVAANLAVVLAQAGLSTILIDADLRRPTQHKIFDLSNDRGLTRLLTRPDEEWLNVCQQTPVSNLLVIPSGPVPPNPADLLSIDRFREVVDAVARAADIVIIDTPPVLSVSDALAVARQCDATLLVVRADHTRRDAVRQSANALRQGGIRLLGVTLNRKKMKNHSGYYYTEVVKPQPAIRRIVSRLLGRKSTPVRTQTLHSTSRHQTVHPTSRRRPAEL
jgi:capsular exopolysaccharide synthesis family protein